MIFISSFLFGDMNHFQISIIDTPRWVFNKFLSKNVTEMTVTGILAWWGLKFDMIRSFRRYMSYMQTCLSWSMSVSQQRNAPIQFDFLLTTCRSQWCGKDSRKWFVWVKVQGPKSGAHIDFQYHSHKYSGSIEGCSDQKWFMAMKKTWLFWVCTGLYYPLL